MNRYCRKDIAKLARLFLIYGSIAILCTVNAKVEFPVSIIAAYGQEGNTTGIGMRQLTSAEALDVVLEPQISPIEEDRITDFKVTFLQPGTDIVQVHVDYDFMILDGDDLIFRAAAQTGQEILHTSEGIVTIPYEFDSTGNYTVHVKVLGINFVPIAQEFADFPITVIPEFSLGTTAVLIGTASIIAATIILGRTPRNLENIHGN